MTFYAALEAVEQLTLEEQEQLTEIVRRRLAERGRQRVIAEVREADREFAAGEFRASTADELMDELLP